MAFKITSTNTKTLRWNTKFPADTGDKQRMGRDSRCTASHANDDLELCKGGHAHVGRCKEILFNAKMIFETCAGIEVLYAKCSKPLNSGNNTSGKWSFDWDHKKYTFSAENVICGSLKSECHRLQTCV
jgi:hypothetical protein